MKAKWSLNPDFKDLERFLELSKEYDTAFEYIDFTVPAVYQDTEETRKRIEAYKALDRDRSQDTLHGVFYDVCFLSEDDVLRERSRELMYMSLDIGTELGVKGVVFHTGILGGQKVPYYLEGWDKGMSEFLPTVAKRYQGLNIYLENTVESTPKEIVTVAEALKDLGNVKLCLDYAHASIKPRLAEDWVKAMSPYVAHMHLNDNDTNNDLHLACGDGNINMKKFCSEYEYYGLNTTVLLEVSGYDKAKRSLEYVSRL